VRRAVKERHGLGSVEPLHAGVFMVVQRFRSDLGLFVHPGDGSQPRRHGLLGSAVGVTLGPVL
jgi:hypothetical protein